MGLAVGAILPARVYRWSVAEPLSATVSTKPDRALLVRDNGPVPGAKTARASRTGHGLEDRRARRSVYACDVLESDARATSGILNGIAGPGTGTAGMTNNADQRDLRVDLKHENRFVIMEATVPRGDAPPVASTSSNWLDEQGRRSASVNLCQQRTCPKGASGTPPRNDRGTPDSAIAIRGVGRVLAALLQT